MAKNPYNGNGTAKRTIRSEPNSTRYPSAKVVTMGDKVKLKGNRRGSGKANLKSTTGR